MRWLFASGGQSIGAEASSSVFPVNTQVDFLAGLTGLIFRIDWFDLLAVQGTLKSHKRVKSLIHPT